MKKVLFVITLIALLVASCCPNASAQYADGYTPKRVGDPKTYMTAEQLAKYDSDMKIAELEKKLDTYGKWVGVGGEIGTAVQEGLEAVVDVADKFGQTDVGKFTLIMIAWKVMGRDAVRIVLGIIFIIMFIWLLIYSFRKTCIERRVLVKQENKGFLRYPKTKEWKIIEPLLQDGDGLGIVRIAHIVFFLIAIWITYGIMFGGS